MEYEVRVWMEGTTKSVVEALSWGLRAIDDWPLRTGPWSPLHGEVAKQLKSGIAISDGGAVESRERLARKKWYKKLSRVDQIVKVAESLDESISEFWCSSSFNLVEWKDASLTKSSEGEGSMTLRCRARAWDYPIWGDLRFEFLSPDEDSLASCSRILLDFLSHLCEAGSVEKVSVFSGRGEYLPLNSRVSFYTSEAGILADIDLVLRMWRHGLGPKKQLAPLSKGRLGWALHESRSPEEQADLKSLLDGSSNERRWIEQAARSAYQSPSIDSLDVGSGRMFYVLPDVMNNFVTDLFLPALRAGTAV